MIEAIIVLGCIAISGVAYPIIEKHFGEMK